MNEKGKMFAWPVWFPYPRCWLKAMWLEGVICGLLWLMWMTESFNYLMLEKLFHRSELLIIILIFWLLFPILVLAFSHALVEVVYSSRFKFVASSGGFLPGLMSWWEGLYGWLVFALSSLLVLGMAGVVLPIFNLGFLEIWQANRWDFYLIIMIGAGLWLFMAAGFYQVELLVKNTLITASDDKFFTAVAKETNNKSSLKVAWINFLKKAFIPLLIILGTLRSYGANTWTHSQNTIVPVEYSTIFFWPQRLFCQIDPSVKKIPSSMIAKNPVITDAPLPVPYAPPLPEKPNKVKFKAPPTLEGFDPFQQGVYKATTAANLAQIAETRDEWQGVVKQWQDAIKLMQAVPKTSPNSQRAEKKVIEYEQNLIYAQKAAGVTDFKTKGVGDGGNRGKSIRK